MLNLHSLSFKPLAEMWGLEYGCFDTVPNTLRQQRNRLIELVPDEQATIRFWKRLGEFDATYATVHAG
jgi:2-succinyl-5-enolpyruvyl-6-hydroxy-3-cyclohexene-1-carboxylate synthase